MVDKRNYKILIADCNNLTSLLQSALNQVLKTDINSLNSCVHFNLIQFDFPYFRDLTIEEVQQVECNVNEKLFINHEENTSSGLFHIISESNLKIGIRRIEAVNGFACLKYLQDKEYIVNQLARILKVRENDILYRVHSLIDRIKKMKLELKKGD